MRSASGREEKQFKNSFSPVTSTHVLSPSSAASPSMRNRSTIYHLMQKSLLCSSAWGEPAWSLAEKEKLRNMFQPKKTPSHFIVSFVWIALILGRVGDHYPPQIFLHFNHFLPLVILLLVLFPHLACAHRIVNLRTRVHNAIHRRGGERCEDDEAVKKW